MKSDIAYFQIDYMIQNGMKERIINIKEKKKEKKGQKNQIFFIKNMEIKEKKIAEIFKRQRRNPYVFMR